MRRLKRQVVDHARNSVHYKTVFEQFAMEDVLSVTRMGLLNDLDCSLIVERPEKQFLGSDLYDLQRDGNRVSVNRRKRILSITTIMTVKLRSIILLTSSEICFFFAKFRSTKNAVTLHTLKFLSTKTRSESDQSSVPG